MKTTFKSLKLAGSRISLASCGFLVLSGMIAVLFRANESRRLIQVGVEGVSNGTLPRNSCQLENREAVCLVALRLVVRYESHVEDFSRDARLVFDSPEAFMR